MSDASKTEKIINMATGAPWTPQAATPVPAVAATPAAPVINNYPIVLYPDPVLTSGCRELTPFEVENGIETSDEKNALQSFPVIADRMYKTMAESGGVGLAAPQVGLPIRMFVANVNNGGKFLALINPVVEDVSGYVTEFEGCLSLPGISARVRRHSKIVVSGLDPLGRPQKLDLSGFQARVVQHEIDHLDGIMFLERLENQELKRVMEVLRRLLDK